MVFEQLTTKVKRILEYRREGAQQFDFTIDKVVEGLIQGGNGIGWRDPDIPSYVLYIDKKDSIAPDYLSYVEIKQDHPISESLVDAWQQGHTIRFRGEYDLRPLHTPTFIYLLILPFAIVVDGYQGQIVVEDRSTRQEIKTFNTFFQYWYGKYYGYLFGRQPIARLPPVEVDRGIGYQMLQAGLDPAEHPVDEASDYVMILSCGYCKTGKLYSQPRVSNVPRDVSLSCNKCGSEELTTLYQNF